MNKLIDQHVWYEGSVDLYNDNDDYNFSDLSDESKESIASAIVESIRRMAKNCPTLQLTFRVANCVSQTSMETTL